MFYADLHIHSRFSRATSKNCNLEQLAFWAGRKGLAVIGTGDFTHPAWLNEIKTKLVPAEPGLFRLRRDLEKTLEQQQPSTALLPETTPSPCEFGFAPVRFLLQVEISTIYKQGDRTRKVHHLVYVPDVKSAESIIHRLSRIGNLGSDGRPILGLNSRDLLEITLESSAGAYLIPAHIWTPWFSALGSKSGFDSIAECYGDLAAHIFAVETGLSSDPLMNWRLSWLDRYRLVSNSDAHSPPNLGREACVFDTELNYFSMRSALETGAGFKGTVEFFPEEGKYHLDGHRKCGVCFSPEETKQHHGLCPVCGQEVTVGVLYRVAELADRPAGTRLQGAAPFRSFIPLAEMLSEIIGTGTKSNKVRNAYDALISSLGPELFILGHAPLEDIRRVYSPLLAEAIARMRAIRVIRDAGFDGEYGTIRLFEKNELKRKQEGASLFDLAGLTAVPPLPSNPAKQSESTAPRPSPEPEVKLPAPAYSAVVKPLATPVESLRNPPKPRTPFLPVAIRHWRTMEGKSHGASWRRRVKSAPDASNRVLRQRRDIPCQPECSGILNGLDPDQRLAAEITDRSLLIMAGPGTGKTRTLTHRIAHLVANHGVLPERCLAITFTRRAAGEMQARLARLVPDKAGQIAVLTFHALGYSMLREHGKRLRLTTAVRVAREDERVQVLMETLSLSERKARKMLADLSRLKRQGHPPEPESEAPQSLDRYQRAMRARALLDFDDLIGLPLELLDTHPDLAAYYRERYPWIFIDEYQDIDEQQYRLVKQLVLPAGNICAIGDPDQAIYGFRGTDVKFFRQFTEDFPNARTVRLTRNYRSGRMIVDACLQVIAPSSLVEGRTLHALVDDPTRIVIHDALTDRAEAEFVVHTIERLIGGTTFFSHDSGRVQAGEDEATFSFSDFGVLYRTDAQAETLCEAFTRSGMPFQKRSHQSLMETPGVLTLINAMQKMPEGAPGERLDKTVAKLGEETNEWNMMRGIQALRLLAERCGDMETFLSELAMGTDVDLWDARADCVSLLTMHASKGLEFPVVFIVGCEDGILPLRWGNSADGNVDEERRLFFVGMSRARTRLFLCHARRRLWQGKARSMEPSPFLRNIEEQLLEHSRSEARRKKPRPPHEQLSLFDGSC